MPVDELIDPARNEQVVDVQGVLLVLAPGDEAAGVVQRPARRLVAAAAAHRVVHQRTDASPLSGAHVLARRVALDRRLELGLLLRPGQRRLDGGDLNRIDRVDGGCLRVPERCGRRRRTLRFLLSHHRAPRTLRQVRVGKDLSRFYERAFEGSTLVR